MPTETPTPSPTPAKAGETPTLAGPAAPPDWRGSLPKEYWADKSLEQIKGKDASEAMPTLVKNYINAQKMVGADKVIIPGPNATDEEISVYRAKMGIPEAPDKYELPTEGMPQDVQFDKGVMDGFLKLAHTTGMSRKQVAELYRWQAGMVQTYRKQQEETKASTRKEVIESLKKKWGQSFEEKDAMATKMVKQFGGDKTYQKVLEKDWWQDEDMMEMFAAAGKALASDSIHGEGVSRQFMPSPQEAQSQIKKQMLDNEFMSAYTSKKHPGHEAAVEKMRELYEAAHVAPAE